MSATVEAGRYLLEVGGRPGTLISSPAQPQDGDARALRRALKKGGAGRPRNKSAVDPLANAVDEASESTAAAERAVALFTALAEGNVLDPKLLSSEIDVLVDLVERLDRRGRWKEALRLARALSGLLALTMRWVELVRSLKIALEAAEKLGDSHALGWAKHELGTLHLAAEDTAAAERRLGEAREIRRRLDDRRGLAATNRNLEVLCQNLRQLLRDGRLVRRRTLLRPALGIVVALLVAAGVASAVVTSGDATEPPGPPAAAACDNERDDDGDGRIDFPNDPDCDSPGDTDETHETGPPPNPPPAAACDNARDDDGDGLVDFPNDPDCDSSDDTDETGPPPNPPPAAACDNARDDDGDGLIDFPNDPDCDSSDDTDEADPVVELPDDTGPDDPADELAPGDDGNTNDVE